MLDIVFAMIAASAGVAGGPPEASTSTIPTAPDAAIQAAPLVPLVAPTVDAAEGSVIVGAGTLLEGVPATPSPQAATVPDTAVAATPTAPAAPAAQTSGFNMAVVPPGLVAEPQNPGGKFTTATEIKPILGATKGNWIAVREYDGKDLLYVTHLWGWRCGLAAMAISVNDEPMQNWPLPACHTEYSTPNAILEEDGLPYLSLRLGAVQKVTIQVVYDDLSMDAAEFQRSDVLIP